MPLMASFRTNYTRTVVQTEGSAFRVDADVFKATLHQCPTLARQLQRHSLLMAMQSGTGCNLQSASRRRRKIGAVAADDCRPGRHKLSSTDAGVSWADVRNPPLERNCLSWYFAEGWTDRLHAGKRNHPG